MSDCNKTPHKMHDNKKCEYDQNTNDVRKKYRKLDLS